MLSKFFLCVPLLGKAYTSFCLMKPNPLYQHFLLLFEVIED
jgi:hypothetical protein